MNQQYIRITTIINLLLIFAVSIPLILSVLILTNDGFDSYARFFILMACSGIAILLNTLRFHILSKIITSITPVAALIAVPIFINHFIHAGMFLWIPYAIISIGVIPFFIFSLENEKMIMFSVLGFYIMLIVGFDELLMSYFNQLPDLSFIKKYYMYYLMSKITIAVFLYTSFFVFKYSYHDNRMKLQELSDELEKKNQTLHMLNTTLENKVAERTEKLTLQNDRIKNLAYTNAHEIRAYIVRIKGLMQISKHNISQDEKVYCETKIYENISDLDILTQKLSKELIEEN